MTVNKRPGLSCLSLVFIGSLVCFALLVVTDELRNKYAPCPTAVPGAGIGIKAAIEGFNGIPMPTGDNPAIECQEDWLIGALGLGTHPANDIVCNYALSHGVTRETMLADDVMVVCIKSPTPNYQRTDRTPVPGNAGAGSRDAQIRAAQTRAK